MPRYDMSGIHRYPGMLATMSRQQQQLQISSSLLWRNVSIPTAECRRLGFSASFKKNMAQVRSLWKLGSFGEFKILKSKAAKSQFAHVLPSLSFIFGAVICHVRKRDIVQVRVPRKCPALAKAVTPQSSPHHLHPCLSASVHLHL